ncbi:hypothetical protein LguiA_016380 [Lonicera macranthoides]
MAIAPVSVSKQSALRSSSKRLTLMNYDFVLIRAKCSPMERAEEVQANLPSKFPSFIKLMLPSHVAGGFWLSFPKQFCDSHMPKHDEKVVLVNESEEKYETKYLVEKNGLSAGWRGFSIAHKLLEKDVLVFQLIQPCVFKVYIVRANGLTEIDGAIGLLTLDPCSAKPLNIAGEIYSEPVLSLEENHQDNSMLALNTDQSENDSDEFGSEIFQGITFSQSVADFKDVKGIEDFNILVDGLIINSVMPSHLRIKYYELCCSQKSYLHENLLEGLNFKLTVGIINETVNIADAIRACKISSTTCGDNMRVWDKTLKAFEELGMKVGFLRARITKLVGLLSVESKEVMMEAKRVEKEKAEEEMRSIERRLVNVKEVIRSIGAEVETLKKVKGTEVLFEEEANAPW